MCSNPVKKSPKSFSSKSFSFKAILDLKDNKKPENKAVLTREEADELLKKETRNHDLRESLLESCNNNFDVFNPKMFEFFSKILEKEQIWYLLQQTRCLQETMIQSDQEFCEPAIEAAIKLLDTGKLDLVATRDLLRSRKKEGKFNEEEIKHLSIDLPKNLKDSYLTSFIEKRAKCSKNDNGEFSKEAFDLYNKLYSKVKIKQQRTNITDYLAKIVSQCFVNNKFNTKLRDLALEASKDEFTPVDAEALSKVLKHYINPEKKQINEEAIKTYTNLLKNNYVFSIDGTMGVLENPDKTFPQEAYQGYIKLRNIYKIDMPEGVVEMCKDNEGFFEKGLFDIAEKYIKACTNSGEKEFLPVDSIALSYYLKYAKNGDETAIDKNKKEIVDMVYYGICGSSKETNGVLLALGEKHFETNFEHFKKLYTATHSVSDSKNIILMGLNKDSEFEPELFEQMQNLKKEMLNRKTELRFGNDDLSDKEIEKSFNDNLENIKKTLEFLGYKGTTYLFKYKLDGFEDYVEKIASFINGMDRVNPRRKEAFTHLISPSVTNADKKRAKEILKLKEEIKNSKTSEQAKKETLNSEKIKQIESEISALKKQLTDFKGGKTSIQEQIKAKIKETNTLKAENKSFIASPEKLKDIDKIQGERNEYSKAEIKDFQNKIDAINIISSINMDSNDFYLLYPYLDPKTKQEKQILKTQLSKLLFNLLDLEYDKTTSEKLNLESGKYLSSIFGADEEFKENFADLVAVLKNAPKDSVADTLNKLSSNRETKKQFEANGIDYEKWATTDKNSYLNVQVKTDIEKARQNAVKNLESDLNDPLLEIIPFKEKGKLFESLQKAGFTIEQKEEMSYDNEGFASGKTAVKRLFLKGKPLEFEHLEKALKALKEEFSQNEFWSKKLDSEKIKSARDTIYTHIIKMRIPEADTAKDLKTSEETNLEVHKTDMNNISQSLFLGNHANCCTAVENTNGWSAPNYIKHKLISGIEVMDKDDFVGNTMCYFAKVDGELALVLDNIELKAKYQYNDKIRDTMINYAKKLTQEVGKPNLPIYAGPNRHKVDLKAFPLQSHEINIIGSTDEDEIYLDLDAEGHTINGRNAFTTTLYKLN